MNKLLKVTYAVSVAFSQAIATFAQIRSDQHEIATMTDNQVQQLISGNPQKMSIGFQARSTKD
jgi:hypothetical protein